LFDIERSINGQSVEQRRAVRPELSAPLVAGLECWLREQRPKLSRGNDLAKAMDYMLKRWPASLTMAASASRTTPLNAHCAALPSAESRGCSRVPTGVGSVPQRCTASSSPRK